MHVAQMLSDAVKTWYVRGERARTIMTEGKKRIQRELKETLAINVGFPPLGSGSTNNGNTAHRFFSNASVSQSPRKRMNSFSINSL